MKTVFKLLIASRKSLVVFIVSFLFSLLALTFVPPAHAQSNYCPGSPGVDNTAVKQAQDNRNLYNQQAIKSGNYDSNVFQGDSVVYGLTDALQTLITGCSTIHPETNIATANNSALAGATNLVTALYLNPPASGVQYVAQEINRFNPVQPAFAQAGGIGFNALSPVERVWGAFRNISYLGFVIVFIVIGFMVMFRSKISPQAVATVQDSLPRIVVALILVTFSYAIVGLMIDAMFVILNVAINALGPGGAGLIDVGKANAVTSSNVFSVVLNSWGDIFGSVFQAINGIIGNMVSGAFGKFIGNIGGGLVAIMAGIAMLFIMFRIFMMLLMSYISIIILTIFAPFILLFQALPGSNGAKEWFKQVAANIAVFPTVALMFILGGMLSGITALGATGAGQFSGQNNLVGQFPLFTGGLNIQNIGDLIGIGILFMTPGAAKIVKERFGIKEGGALGAGGAMAAASIGAGAGALGRTAGSVTSPVTGAFKHAAQNELLERTIGRNMYGQKVGRGPAGPGKEHLP